LAAFPRLPLSLVLSSSKLRCMGWPVAPVQGSRELHHQNLTRAIVKVNHQNTLFAPSISSTTTDTHHWNLLLLRLVNLHCTALSSPLLQLDKVTEATTRQLHQHFFSPSHPPPSILNTVYHHGWLRFQQPLAESRPARTWCASAKGYKHWYNNCRMSL
jgi:hypothetical protein